jgi:hypothetical protein
MVAVRQSVQVDVVVDDGIRAPRGDMQADTKVHYVP